MLSSRRGRQLRGSHGRLLREREKVSSSSARAKVEKSSREKRRTVSGLSALVAVLGLGSLGAITGDAAEGKEGGISDGAVLGER